MNIFRNLYKTGISHLIPGIIVMAIVAIAVLSANGQLENAGGSEVVVAETDPVSIDKNKKDVGNEDNPPVKVGDIDLANCADGKYTGRGQGYAGYLEVEVTVKDHKMTKIRLIKNQADDAPYLAKAKAVIPRVVKAQSLDVDSISGATYSTNGILAAIEDALLKSMGRGSSYKESKKKKKTPVAFDDGEYNDGTFIGSAGAYRGNIDVAVTIKFGKITTIVITKTQDDQEYLADAKAVIPAMIRKQSPNVDTVSGATYSSKGIINATKKALNKARKDPSKKEDPAPEEKPVAPQIPDPGNNDGITPLDIEYLDGTYYGTGLGYNTSFRLKVEVAVYQTKILRIELIEHQDDLDYILPAAKILFPKIIKRQGINGIDTVSEATYSSWGILDAVDDALKDAVKP